MADAYMALFEAYADKFPGTMPDSRGMSSFDFDRLPSLMALALRRGSPITVADLTSTPDTPDPSSGKVL